MNSGRSIPRDDDWGGCRTEFTDRILKDLTEMDRTGKLMEELSMDYVNVSAGMPGVTSEITRPTKPSKHFHLNLARYAKHD